LSNLWWLCSKRRKEPWLINEMLGKLANVCWDKCNSGTPESKFSVFFACVLSLIISWRYFVFLEVNLMSISWIYYIKMSFNFMVLYNQFPEHSKMNELLAFVDLVVSCSFKLIICCLKAWWLWGSNEIWLWINPFSWCYVLKVVWCCKCEYFMVSCSFTPNWK
jgi:hypothetical protein